MEGLFYTQRIGPASIVGLWRKGRLVKVDVGIVSTFSLNESHKFKWFGCLDAHQSKQTISFHHNGSINFDTLQRVQTRRNFTPCAKLILCKDLS